MSPVPEDGVRVPARRQVLCIGHRGAAGHAPENTLLSLREAVRLGADWVEIDVRQACDRLFVLHDGRVDRTTDGTGRLDRMDTEQIRSLDAGSGERIPFLSEVLETVAGRTGLNIEIKTRGTAGPLCRILRTCPREKILISSFHFEELRELRRLDDHIRIGPLFVRPPRDILKRMRSLCAWSVHLDHRFISRPLVERIHDAGINVFVYTVNRIGAIRQAIEAGVDGIISDYPERVVRVRDGGSA